MSTTTRLGNVTDLYGDDQHTDWAAAFGLSVSVASIDAEGLGLAVAEQNSDFQADFLTGLLEGFARFDTPLGRSMQLQHIAGHFTAEKKATGLAVADMIRELADAIEARCAR